MIHRCPVCGFHAAVWSRSGRLAAHGPVKKRCPGSGTLVAIRYNLRVERKRNGDLVWKDD